MRKFGPDSWSSTSSKPELVVDGKTINLTCTVGVCAVSGVFENMEELVCASVTAYRNAKENGGSAVAVKDSADEDTKLKRHDAIWVKRIKAAMLEDRFRLAHLPIAGLRNDSVAMFDMLIRMIDEQGNTVLPSEFLPAADRNNLMKTIDRWIIGAALSHCSGTKADKVFVRLSTQSLRDRTLAEWINSELQARGTSAGALCLQVSEQEAARYIKPAQTLAQRLKSLGVAFALEHYGVDKVACRFSIC